MNQESIKETTHVIVEVDRDYNTVTGTESKHFESDEAAHQYAREKDWSGYEYHAYTKKQYFSR